VADSFEEIKSSCYCNSKTIFNARIDENRNIVTDGEQIEVGGDNRYTSVCRKCYFEQTNHPLYKRERNKLD
jgi:thymidine kinase